MIDLILLTVMTIMTALEIITVMTTMTDLQVTPPASYNISSPACHTCGRKRLSGPHFKAISTRIFLSERSFLKLLIVQFVSRTELGRLSDKVVGCTYVCLVHGILCFLVIFQLLLILLFDQKHQKIFPLVLCRGVLYI